MRRPDRGKGHSKEVQGHAQDGLSHGDVEVFDDRLDACSVASDAECAAEVSVSEPCYYKNLTRTHLHRGRTKVAAQRDVNLPMRRPSHRIVRIARRQ